MRHHHARPTTTPAPRPRFSVGDVVTWTSTLGDTLVGRIVRPGGTWTEPDALVLVGANSVGSWISPDRLRPATVEDIQRAIDELQNRGR